MIGFDEWYDNFFDENYYIPCASEAWNEQQKKIDAIKEVLSDELEYDEIIVRKIKEILKCGET